ncbi:beta-glucosidase BglX [Brevundimonas sp.]|jgi:beta-glucosidase|uniref:beta-glucosidase BglX n=1 Tax=Brevundimonas sp. TaxID=1871086 RepID=UPI0018553AA3|nr:beta-glucosidase BglX [Brevundimonas sp.]MBA4808904.1 beta-glucosidase BglX [Brevundimonas sp.]
MVLKRLCLALAAGLLGLSLSTAGAATAQTVDAPSQRVRDLLGRMTLEEKIGQLNQVPGGRQRALNSRLDAAALERVRRGEIGSFLHVAGAAQIRDLQRLAVEESRLGVPLLFGMDVVHGYKTLFPVPLALAASWDPELVQQTAHVAAMEATAAGLNWTFSPMVDIARDARWGRVVEGAGEDPYLGSILATAQVRGYQGQSLADAGSILATAKHFVGYGAAQGGRDYDSADISDRTLHEVYLPPFYAAAQAGAGSMMTAFNDIAGVPLTAHPALVRELLRGQWGYDGLIVSDWNAIPELLNHAVAGTPQEAGALALRGGVDMDMAGNLYSAQLKGAVEADPSLLPLLDESVVAVLTAKERLGLFDDPYGRTDPAREAEAMLTPEHRALAREAARRSIVLLKNDGDLLPLAASARRIAVIGALAEDANSSLGSWRAQGKVEDVRPLIPALREAMPQARFTYAQGYRSEAAPTIAVTAAGEGAQSVRETSDAEALAEAVDAARAADLVLLVVGEHFDRSGEARSYTDIGLSPAQNALAAAVLDTGKPVVVILMNGRPLAIPELARRAPAILETWFLGVESGPAIADILTGRVSPGGRLPIVFPRASGAAPVTYAHLPTGRPAAEDLTRDTARYRDQPITPLFAFGHGLSYGRFEYGDLDFSQTKIDAGGQVEVSVVVRNTSALAADEVIQLYVRDPVAAVSRPVQELRGFRRVAFAPGEAKRVRFTLTPAQVAFWEADGWRIQPGAIEVMVGASSADIRARGVFTITTEGMSTIPAAAIPTPSAEEPVS